MGQIIASYFEKAKAKGGLQLQVKLALLTRMSQVKAQAQEDSPENIKLFEESFAKL